MNLSRKIFLTALGVSAGLTLMNLTGCAGAVVGADVGVDDGVYYGPDYDDRVWVDGRWVAGHRWDNHDDHRVYHAPPAHVDHAHPAPHLPDAPRPPRPPAPPHLH